MTAALGIHERRQDAVTVLELSGWLVALEGDERFRQHIATLVRAGNTNILVDLSHVTYIDSGGVGAMVAAMLHVTRRGGRLKLLSPSSRVVRVLEITGLLAVFEVFDDEAAAVVSFTPPPVIPG